MASEEMRKKWGTIFMGEREASVEELKAMHERLNREKVEKEQTEDYMERVRARATDRAREILGQAYTERQKVLDEAKGEAAVSKRLAAQEAAKIKGEAEQIRKQAEEELAKAQKELAEAGRIRNEAHAEGYEAGMNQAGAELQEFRGELGQSLAVLLRAIERQRKNILDNWREDLAELVRCAVHAGTGHVLQKEHEAVLQSLVFKALDLLENRSLISLRVNPTDEESVSDMFRAARERAPELRQWTVHGDDTIEPGGLVADSGSGSIDLRRSNYREMVDGILSHLALPGKDGEDAEKEVANLVEQEVAHIASLTPEVERGEQEPEVEPEPAPEEAPERVPPAPPEEAPEEETGEATAEVEETLPDEPEPEIPEPVVSAPPTRAEENPTLAELEDELFPLDEAAPEEAPESVPPPEAQPVNEEERKIFSEGGFL